MRPSGLLVFLGAAAIGAADDYDPSTWNPYNLTDCRNETAEAGPQIGTNGKLVVQRSVPFISLSLQQQFHTYLCMKGEARAPSKIIDALPPFNKNRSLLLHISHNPIYYPLFPPPSSSWHIHYTTNTTDQSRFYYAFIDQFSEYFPPASSKGGNLCPFGPNFGRFSYEYMCSLESAPEEGWAAERALAFEQKHGASADARFSPLRAVAESSRRLTEEAGPKMDEKEVEAAAAAGKADATPDEEHPIVGENPWGGLPQRAFFVPLALKNAAWAWSQKNLGHVDIGLHPNTGCMHDDHGLRITWVLGDSDSDEDPTISTLAFPCNVPATGCNDNDFTGGEPSCGCSTPLESDAPADSCKNCDVNYETSW